MYVGPQKKYVKNGWALIDLRIIMVFWPPKGINTIKMIPISIHDVQAIVTSTSFVLLLGKLAHAGASKSKHASESECECATSIIKINCLFVCLILNLMYDITIMHLTAKNDCIREKNATWCWVS
jgi:hypothetical protein